MKQVAAELGVRYVVEGSVRRSGDRVRVTAQLVDAEAANHIWAERYDRDVNEVFAVQDEITTAVVTAILPAVADAEMQRGLAKAAREPWRLGSVPARSMAREQGARDRQCSGAWLLRAGDRPRSDICAGPSRVGMDLSCRWIDLRFSTIPGRNAACDTTGRIGPHDRSS